MGAWVLINGIWHNSSTHAACRLGNIRSTEAVSTHFLGEEYHEPRAHYFGVPAFGIRNAAALTERIHAALPMPDPTLTEALVNKRWRARKDSNTCPPDSYS